MKKPAPTQEPQCKRQPRLDLAINSSNRHTGDRNRETGGAKRGGDGGGYRHATAGVPAYQQRGLVVAVRAIAARTHGNNDDDDDDEYWEVELERGRYNGGWRWRAAGAREKDEIRKVEEERWTE